MFQKICLLLLLLTLFTVSGCVNTSKPETVEVNNEHTDWKTLKDKVYLSKLEVGQGMSWNSAQEGEQVGFLMKYPEDWIFDNSSVFYDKDNNKVAELAPIAQSTANIYETFKDYQTFEGELIKKESFEVNGCKGLKIIEKVPVTNGKKPFWYVYKYFISDGNKIFTIFFYAYDMHQTNENTFSKIIGYFSFN